jgi:prevent-host-death family protein
MYILYMNSVASTYARQNWAETIELAKTEPVVVTDHGRPAVVMMNAELARLALQVLEDSRDVEDAYKALERIDAGGKTYSLSEVAAELGIDLDSL